MAIQQVERAERIEQEQPKRRLFTLDEYERMIEAAIFEEDEHLELIRGEIIAMPPIGDDHGMGVSNVTTILAAQVGNSARLWPQNAIQFPNNTRPQPDFALLKPGKYGKQRPVAPEDVLLIIEVSDTTLKFDRDTKGKLYAEAGILEYWIVNLPGRVIEVYTEPSGGTYKQMRKAKPGDTLPLPAGMGVVAVSDILG